MVPRASKRDLFFADFSTMDFSAACIPALLRQAIVLLRQNVFTVCLLLRAGKQLADGREVVSYANVATHISGVEQVGFVRPTDANGDVHTRFEIQGEFPLNDTQDAFRAKQDLRIAWQHDVRPGHQIATANVQHGGIELVLDISCQSKRTHVFDVVAQWTVELPGYLEVTNPSIACPSGNGATVNCSRRIEGEESSTFCRIQANN